MHSIVYFRPRLLSMAQRTMASARRYISVILTAMGLNSTGTVRRSSGREIGVGHSRCSPLRWTSRSYSLPLLIGSQAIDGNADLETGRMRL